MANEPVIVVENVSKKYKLYDSRRARLIEALHPFKKRYHRDFWALRDIDFQVRRGQTVGVIGVNGSGKSTLLQIICGVLQATTGSVCVNGKITALLELGSGFNPEFSGRENVFLQGAILGMSHKEIDRRYQAIVNFADIGGFIDQPVKTYSSGMIVRLAFAVAINVDPDVLIIDEALAVGDVFFQSKCFSRIRELRNRGTACLFVSHNMNIITALCDDVILLDAGRIVCRGNPKETTEAYRQSRFLAMGSVKLEDDVAIQPLPTAPTSANAENSISVALENVSRHHGNGKARLVDYTINGVKRPRETGVSPGDDLEIRLVHSVTKDIAHPLSAIRITTGTGVVVYATNTTFNKPDIRPLRSGDLLTTTFRLKAHLAIGQYLLTVVMAEWIEHEVVYVDRLVDAVALHVEGGPYPCGGVCNLEGRIDVTYGQSPVG